MKIEDTTLFELWEALKESKCSLSSSEHILNKDRIIECYNRMYNREVEFNLEFTKPTRRLVPGIEIHLDKNKFIIKDYDDFLLSLFAGPFAKIGGESLYMNIIGKGLNQNYFRFSKEDEDNYVKVVSILDGSLPEELYKKNKNIIRFLNIINKRAFPVMKFYPPEKEFHNWKCSFINNI